MWYLDSGCSRYMTGEKKNFKNFKRKEQGFVTYGDNNKGKILGTGDVGGGILWRSRMYCMWKG